MYKKLTFICNKIPNNLTAHSLFRKITNLKSITNYKVEISDKFVYIYLKNEDILNTNDNFEFFDKEKNVNIVCILVSNEDAPLHSFENGDYININGQISYAIKDRVTHKKQCPINNFGNFDTKKLNNEKKQHFINYLENNLGIVIDNFDDLKFSRNLKDEIYLNTATSKLFINIFNINGNVFVKNKDIINLLSVNAVGKDKSYGFGNFNIIKNL